MGLLDELKRALGIDEVDGPPEAPGPTEERTARLRELGLEPPEPPLMVDPPPARWNAGYVDKGGQVQPAENRESARILAEASQMLKERSGQGARAGRGAAPSRGQAVASAAERTAPPEKAPTDDGKAELLLAMKNASKPPEDQGEEPNPTPGQQIDPEPTSSTGADKPAVATGLSPPPTPPPEHNASGGPLGAVSRLVMGAGGDPRTQRLREALERSGHMKRLAGHLTGMGIGADIARGDGFHRADQGKDLRDRADDEVLNETVPTQYEQKNARFDTEQQRAAQDYRLRDAGEGRAQAGELRAGAADRRAQAGEARQQKGFETQQSEFDGESETSANARAEAEALYPAAWKKLPQHQREHMSAHDVGRIFSELSMKDFAPKGTGRSGVNDRMDARLAAGAKLPNAGKILDLNDVLATIEEGKAPGTGYIMNKDGWQNFLRTPQGVAFKQKTQAIINKHIKDTTGLVVRESEEGRIMGELGYGSWDDANALDSGLHKMAEESQADLDQTLNKLPPHAKQLLIEQGAVPKIGGKYGKSIKGSTRNFGDEDTFNPRELLRRALNFGGRDRKLGNDPQSADEQDAEEKRRGAFRF